MLCLNVIMWLSRNQFLIHVWGRYVQGTVRRQRVCQILHGGQTLLGNLGEFEGIVCLCSVAPITLASSSFYLSHIQIWPSGKGEWESNRPALLKWTNKDLKRGNISAHTQLYLKQTTLLLNRGLGLSLLLGLRYARVSKDVFMNATYLMTIPWLKC